MRSGNYKAGQRKVIFIVWIRLEHLYTDEVDNMAALLPPLLAFVHWIIIRSPSMQFDDLMFDSPVVKI